MSEASQTRLADDEFLCAFESCSLPPENFHHRDHLRLAWIYLTRYNQQEAQRQSCASIRRYTHRHNASAKYHATMTVAWLRLVADAMRHAPAGCEFDALITRFPQLLDKNALAKYYSAAYLSSFAARDAWLEPDLFPLP